MTTINSDTTKRGQKRYRVRYRTLDRKQTGKRGFRTKREAEQFAATVGVAKLRGVQHKHCQTLRAPCQD